MAKLIEMAADVLESLYAAADNKTKYLGSWDAVNDPDVTMDDERDKLAVLKADIEFRDTDGDKRAFLESLPANSRKLRKAYRQMSKQPELYSDEEVTASRQAYEASLTPEQLAQERKIEDDKVGQMLLKMVEGLSGAVEAEGHDLFGDVLDAQRRSVTCKAKPEHLELGHALETILQQGVRESNRVNGKLHAGAVSGIDLDRTTGRWALLPGDAEKEGFELRSLSAALKGAVATELADTKPWQRVTVRGEDALYLENQYMNQSLAMTVAQALSYAPEMQDKIVRVYKINDTSVNEGMFSKATLKDRPANDKTELKEGILFIGEEAQKRLSDMTGLNAQAIEKASGRRLL